MSQQADAPKAIVLGTGFGCRIQVPALRGAGFDVAALVGNDPARTAERAQANGVALAFTDLAQAVERTGAKAVAISTPPHTHKPLVLQAISLGCHVLCEKPFALDGGEATEMLSAAEAAGVVHMLGNEFRWEPPRATALRAVAEGAIGEPRFVSFVQYLEYTSSPDVNLPHWWWDPTVGGGWLGASGSHMVDYIRTWLGEFESLSASLSRVTARPDAAEDSFVVRFRLRSGVEGVLQQTAGCWGPFVSMTRVAGTDGTLWLENGQAWIADRSGTRALPPAPDLLLPPDPPASTDPRQESPEWRLLSSVELGPYTMLARAWRAAIEGRPAPSPVPPATFADGVANMRVLDAIRASAAGGGVLVTLD
jgi:predicted dehydrogenase